MDSLDWFESENRYWNKEIIIRICCLRVFLRSCNRVCLIDIHDTLTRILIGKEIDRTTKARGVFDVHKTIEFVYRICSCFCSSSGRYFANSSTNNLNSLFFARSSYSCPYSLGENLCWKHNWNSGWSTKKMMRCTEWKASPLDLTVVILVHNDCISECMLSMRTCILFKRSCSCLLRSL